MIPIVDTATYNLFNDTPSIILPMTKTSGKVRLKNRNSFYEYGIPFAPRQKPISLSTYVEWQIGYDMLANEENKDKTSIHKTFVNYKGETKYAYELSEIIYYSLKHNLITKKDIEALKNSVKNIDKEQFLDTIPITRTNPIETQKNGIDFFSMRVSYPLLVHKFGQYDIYA